MRSRFTVVPQFCWLCSTLVAACAQSEMLSERPTLSAGSSGAAGGGAAGGAGLGGAGSAAAGSGGNSVAGSAGASAGGSGGAGTSGGAGAGGTSGTDGSASGGAGAGGGGSGGNGGAAGKGGAGGTSAAAGCDQPIPNKTTWEATASDWSNLCTDTTDPLCNLPEEAVDASTSTRFSTGAAQAEGMWLQIDFGASASVSQVVLTSSDTGDFPVGYEVSLSDTSQDFAAPASATGAGAMGTTQTITFDSPATGRYLLIELTAASTVWWSVHDLDVTCE